MTQTAPVRIATYNIHRCRGLDRRVRPDRIAAVLHGLQADIIALQEVVGAGPSGRGQAEAFGAALAMGWVMVPTRRYRQHLFGNVVMSRFPIVQHVEHDITWKSCERRCVQRADVSLPNGTVLHLYNVHLGTALLERRYQAGRLSAILTDRRVRGPRVVLGDFNEWTKGLVTEMMHRICDNVDVKRHLRRKRTYPGVLPLLHLDHIYYRGNIEVVAVEQPRTRTTFVASDHLPLVAELRVGS
ncbi:MAG: endonuclease/exonuclease/phosphatase family protein [Vicinamibacterales bacterium]